MHSKAWLLITQPQGLASGIPADALKALPLDVLKVLHSLAHCPILARLPYFPLVKTNFLGL